MKVFAVIGAGQNSGKTTAVETLVKEFKSRGFRVGAIKQIHEENFSIDKRGKDTWRLNEAGADIVVAASPNEVSAVKRIKGDRFNESLKLLEGQNLDYVIVEGHPLAKMPLIYASRSGAESADKPIPKNTICIVSLSPENIQTNEYPVYHINRDVSIITDKVLECFMTEGASEAKS